MLAITFCADYAASKFLTKAAVVNGTRFLFQNIL
jgi:hypothetical protein